jgi:hypothetical protein
MAEIQMAEDRVDRLVEDLFAKNPGWHGQVCVNPVTGSRFAASSSPVLAIHSGPTVMILRATPVSRPLLAA